MACKEIAVEAVGIADPTIIGQAAQIVADSSNKDFIIYLFGDSNKLEKYASDNVTVLNHSYFPSEKDKSRLAKENLGSSLEKTLEFAKGKNIPALCLASSSATRYVIERENYKLKGIKKPTIAAEVPTIEGFNILVDAGLNPHLEINKKEVVSKEDLVSFGIMGGCYMKAMGYEPTIGFLSFNERLAPKIVIGARKLIEKKSNDNGFKIYPMFFRGTDIGKGKSRVAVSEGDKGNELLTTIEITSENLFTISPNLKKEAPRFNQNNYGAMPILGTSPSIMVGHRSSGIEKATNAIIRTLDFCDIQDEVNELILETL